MIKVDIEVGGQVQNISLDVQNESQAIEEVWRIYGYATPIHRIYSGE